MIGSSFLSTLQSVEEVNFWQPGGRTNFKALQPGELFLFKLHTPRNFMVGGGVFARADILPTSAWEAFGTTNGAASLLEMRKRIALCAVTGERTLPILDAAHIQPYAEGSEHNVTNGLLLRTDIHRLFDLGYVTVSSGGRFEVGRRLREDFENGRHYYAMHGQQLSLPLDARQRPAHESLEWHQTNRFLG
jgi:HNH endonuclease